MFSAESATYKDFLLVQTVGDRTLRRPVAHYNLDAIIAVGYRVNSRRGTQFRIWATRTLREHLTRGFTLNESRLRARGEQGLRDLQQAIALIAKTLSRDYTDRESRSLLDVVERYNYTWQLLVMRSAIGVERIRLRSSRARTTAAQRERYPGVAVRDPGTRTRAWRYADGTPVG